MKFAYILFALVVILQSFGQILERKGMIDVGKMENVNHLLNPDTIIKIITNPYVVIGVLFSALGLFLWLAVLSHTNVSYIYPFGSICYILIAFLATVLLGESISLTRWVGIFIIVLGAILIQR